jgi:cytochrome c peroxidase
MPRLVPASTAQAQAASDWTWDLPDYLPPPRVPADNPMTQAKVALGRYLFYDTRLSGNGTQACATCHLQKLAFTDGRAHGLGSTGQLHRAAPWPWAMWAGTPPTPGPTRRSSRWSGR